MPSKKSLQSWWASRGLTCFTVMPSIGVLVNITGRGFHAFKAFAVTPGFRVWLVLRLQAAQLGGPHIHASGEPGLHWGTLAIF